MWVFKLMVVIIPSLACTAWAFYRWGYRNGVTDECHRWEVDKKIRQMPYSGLFNKEMGT